jgi:signal transduction histidine kinase
VIFRRLATLALVGLVLLAALPTRAIDTAAQVLRIDTAEALLQPPGQPAERRRVALRHRWDNNYPGVGGHVIYTLALPPATAAAPMALLFERVGNQALVRVNGILVQELGTPGDAWYDAGKETHMVTLPAGLLRVDRTNELTVDVTTQPMRLGGLSPVRFGPIGPIAALHARFRLLDGITSAAYAASLLLMGGLAAGLWWRQRDRLYGVFSLAAFFGILRHVDRIGLDPILPWPLWGGVLAVFAGIHLGLVALFSIQILETRTRRLQHAIQGVIVVVVLLAMLAFWRLVPAWWTAAYLLLEVTGLVCFGVVLQAAARSRRTMDWLVVGALGLLVSAGVHDILLLRLGWFGGASVGLTPHAMFLLVCLLAALVVQRYNRTAADWRTLNETLAERIAAREAQLREAFETLRAQHQEQAVLTERQRIMREIHDGIGSQLVGLLNMLGHEDVDRGALEREIRLALDEMRMAVDSLQPMDSDLTVLLATLRYRLQPRFEAAQLEVAWEIDALPPIEGLAPPSILQLQRILLEAFTNVLKHARARRIVVQAHWQEGPAGGVVLRVSDDGVGLLARHRDVEIHGQGLTNMRVRAAAIGATLRIESAASGGTCIVVDWPVGRKAPGDGADALPAAARDTIPRREVPPGEPATTPPIAPPLAPPLLGSGLQA